MDKFEVEPISASWDEGGNVILEVSITLPQQTISKPEALRICELINHALSLDPPEASRILPRGFACVLLSDDTTLAVFYPEGMGVVAEQRQFFEPSDFGRY